MKLDIIADTREQKGLEFKDEVVGSVTVEKLDTGDYSLKGMEDTLCIERKSSLSEFSNNITEKRFWAEMERMREFKYKFLVLEFQAMDIQQFPYSLNLPKSIWSRIKITPQFIFKCVADIQIKYGIHVIFAGNRMLATELILSIMKRTYESR